jgi:hypothetical protein
MEPGDILPRVGDGAPWMWAPRCGATTVFWPEHEGWEAECMKPRGHEGTVHEDEILGEWDES